MTFILLLLTLFGAGIYSIFKSILLPEVWFTSIEYGASSLWALNGFLPIGAIMSCIYWDIAILVSILVFKLVFGAISGKPEID